MFTESSASDLNVHTHTHRYIYIIYTGEECLLKGEVPSGFLWSREVTWTWSSAGPAPVWVNTPDTCDLRLTSALKPATLRLIHGHEHV